MKFFCADSHLGHDNIIRYCNRPFANHEEMDREILQRFNSRLRPGDELYHLGDVAWSTYPVNEFFDALNCKQVHLILGNHDRDVKRFASVRSIVSIRDFKTLHIKGVASVVLFHYAMRSWLGKMNGAYQLYGHSHGKLPAVGRQMDVGVDTNDFFPYSWDEVHAKLRDVPCGAE